jgi:hypothetical protein
MSTESGRSGETIFETFLARIRICKTDAPLSARRLDNIYTVSPAVAARNTLSLTIQTKAEAAHTSKLAHGRLLRESVTHGRHRNGALDAPMRRRSVGGKPWGLE